MLKKHIFPYILFFAIILGSIEFAIRIIMPNAVLLAKAKDWVSFQGSENGYLLFDPAEFFLEQNLLSPNTNESLENIALDHSIRNKYVYAVRVNSKGFRDKDFYSKKEDGVFRIFCLGDSTTYGSGINSEDTISQQLQDMLNVALPGYKIEVINAGFSAFTSSQGLYLLKKKILDYEPDLITVSYGLNNFRLEIVKNFYQNNLLTKLSRRCMLMLNSFFRHSYTYLLCREFIFTNYEMFSRYFSIKREGHHENISGEEDRDEVIDVSVKRFVQDLEAFRDLSIKHQIGIVFIPQPSVPLIRIWGYLRYYEAFLKFCRDNKVEYIDAERIFDNHRALSSEISQFDSRTNWTTVFEDMGIKGKKKSELLKNYYYYIDHVHLNGKGNYLICDALAKKIKPKIEQKQKTPLRKNSASISGYIDHKGVLRGDKIYVFAFEHCATLYNWPFWKACLGFYKDNEWQSLFDKFYIRPIAKTIISVSSLNYTSYKLTGLPKNKNIYIFAFADTDHYSSQIDIPTYGDFIGKFLRNPIFTTKDEELNVDFNLVPAKLLEFRSIPERHRPSLSDSPQRFIDATQKSNIEFYHVQENVKHDLKATMGSGCASVDYNNDGLIDIYGINGSGHSNRLYKNNGNGTFSDITEIVGLGDKGYGMGCVFGDYDNDGFKDLYLTNFGSSKLYHNEGGKYFKEVTNKAGVGNNGWGMNPIFVDYDNDGFLDLFVTNFINMHMQTGEVLLDPIFQISANDGLRMTPYPWPAQRNRLFRNNGNGTFTEVTEKVFPKQSKTKTVGSVFGDFDKDGDMDLYVINFGSPNQMFLNNNGIFFDISKASCANLVGELMGGVAYGDFDNDLDNDFFLTSWRNETNILLRNDLDLNNYGKKIIYRDVSYNSGLQRISWGYVGFGTFFFDYDNDGFLDLFVANGNTAYDKDRANSLIGQDNFLFKNNNDGTFSEVNLINDNSPIFEAASRGACWSDFDNDGDVDIFFLNNNGKASLLENISSNKNYWLKLRLEGVISNRDGIGCKVFIYSGNLKQYREVYAGGSYLSYSQPEILVGVGDHTVIDKIEIIWPSGTVQVINNLKVNQIINIKEI